jgi:hypothetical protein
MEPFISHAPSSSLLLLPQQRLNRVHFLVIGWRNTTILQIPLPTRPQKPRQLYPSKHHTADIPQHIRPYYIHMKNSPTLLPRAMKPSTCRGCAEILGDLYFKISSLSSIGIFPCLANFPKLSCYQVLGQSRIQQKHTTCYNHPKIHAQ